MAPEPSSRLPIYAALNVIAVAAIAVLGAIGPAQQPRVLYLALLFPICTWPLLKVRSLNGPYAILAFFMSVYFVFFAMTDLVGLVGPGFPGVALPPLDAAEAAILLGGLMFLIGYQLAQRATSPRVRASTPADWPMPVLVGCGLTFWIIGAAVCWYWDIHLLLHAADFQNVHSPLVTSALLVGRLMQPLGILILAYAQARSRSRLLLLVLIGVAAFQVLHGFVSSTKGGAMMAGILIIIAQTLVRGRPPLGWLAAALAFVVFAFPVFQAYRAVMVARGVTHAEAAQNLGALVGETFAYMRSQKASPYESFDKAQSFLERSSMKGSVELIVRGTGTAAPYQMGYTLIPALTAMIPRILWPTKLDVQAGQLLNREFRLSEDERTYISPSHLGEMYWNFGWPGVLIGMLLLGLLLGSINRACDLSQHVTVTRLLVLAVTLQQLVVRFEGTIATEYAVWMRSVFGILLLHLLLARRAAPPAPAPTRSPAFAAPTTPLPFPNLMR